MVCAYMNAKSLQSWLFATLWTVGHHGILQARILEWVAMPCPRGSSDPGIKPTSLTSPALADR